MPFSVLSARVLCVRPIGFTSDYCPVCRQERRFHLAQAQRKRYFLCFEQGQEGHAHHELTCFVCGCKVERPADERPIKNLPDPKIAGSFEPESLPIVKSRIADCVAMERALQSGKLKGSDREEMIRYTLMSFARVYDEEPLERIKPYVLLLILFAIFSLCFLGAFGMHRFGSPMSLAAGFLAASVVVFGLIYWVMKHSPRKRVRTWLAMALLPIEPTSEEIHQAQIEMKASRIKAGDRICSHKVLAKIAKMKPKMI